MSGEIFNDGSMLEIFRSEVETHVESLTSGLLALERDPEDTSNIDEMMRGAHSIKGAARIVGVDPAVRVAHVMEDGFVAAQNGKLTLRPEHVDVLLRGVDMLNRIANASKDAGIDWAQFEREATPLVAEITSALAGKFSSAQDVPQAIAPETSSHAATSQSAVSSIENVTIVVPKMLNSEAAEIVRREFVAGLDGNTRSIRFDFSGTLDLDAKGLALLAAVPANVGQNGPAIELSGVSEGIQTVFRATGIDRLYSVGGR